MITLTATILTSDGTLLTIDKSNCKSLSRTITDRKNIDTPSFGIVSNSGSLTFIDAKGQIKQLLIAKVLKSGLETNLYLKNTISNISLPIGEFLTDKWDYDVNSKEVSVSLKDELSEWQDILVESVPYDPYAQKNLSCEWLYNYLYGLTPSKYGMLNYNSLDSETKEILSKTKFEFFILETKNLWNAWNQLCELCQCHIFKNNEGQTTCRYRGGN